MTPGLRNRTSRRSVIRNEVAARLLTIYLMDLTEQIQNAAKAQAAYMVDMADADALDLLGETHRVETSHVPRLSGMRTGSV